jgi:hypothetical protein
MGNAKANSNAKKIVFIAHLDEIGYHVRSIELDGRLLMDVLGGGYTEYFLGHVMLLHGAGVACEVGPARIRMAARAEGHGRTGTYVCRHAFGGRN